MAKGSKRHNGAEQHEQEEYKIFILDCSAFFCAAQSDGLNVKFVEFLM
jgi:hypothetical protein